MNAELENLIRLFAEASGLVEKELLRSLSRDAQSTARQKRMRLTVIGAILARLRSTVVGTEESPGVAWEIVRSSYERGSNRAVSDLRKAGRQPVALQFGGLHIDAMRVLYERLAEELDAAINGTYRRVDQVVRKLALRELLVGQASGRSTEGSIKAVERGLRADGIEAFTDAAGRRWKLPVYARNKVTQAAGDAAAEGTINRLAENGFDLVKVSDHATSCDVCKRYEGRVFSISGESEKYPPLVYAPAFHAHCRHVLTAYIEGLNTV